MKKNIYNSDIAKYINCKLYGEKDKINGISIFPNNINNSLSFLSNIDDIKNIKKNKNSSTVITVPENVEILLKNKYSVISSDQPKYDIALIYEEFFKKEKVSFIDSNSYIGPKVILSKNVTISAGVVLDGNITVGENTYIGNNTIIKNNIKIGKNVQILAGNVIGENAFSFGFSKKPNIETLKRFPSFGGVLIEDNVNVGNNCVITRGIFDNTEIKRYTKINDLVHIGNTVKIGENTLIMANVDISARVNIGKGCWIAQSACLRQGITIGDHTQIGMGSVVTKDIKSGVIAYGSPAKYIKQRYND